MFKVKKQSCDECLFSKDKIVSNKRRQQILSDCRQEDSHFICHKATIDGHNICCHDFYKTQDISIIQISQRMGWIEFVD